MFARDPELIDTPVCQLVCVRCSRTHRFNRMKDECSLDNRASCVIPSPTQMHSSAGNEYSLGGSVLHSPKKKKISKFIRQRALQFVQSGCMDSPYDDW